MEKPKPNEPKPKIDYNKLRPIQPKKPEPVDPDIDLRKEAIRIKKEFGDKVGTVWDVLNALKEERYGRRPEAKKDH